LAAFEVDSAEVAVPMKAGCQGANMFVISGVANLNICAEPSVG